MNILVDGPSRSGKLLTAKLLMCSEEIAFQHYSGDLERILEMIYIHQEKETSAILTEILRINMVHTIEDLKNARQISINKNDSSYYKKSAFYEKFKERFSSVEIQKIIKENKSKFILHTHESLLFLRKAETQEEVNKIMNLIFKHKIYIVRNPGAQALSWIKRGYTKSWNDNNKSTPFLLYATNYKLKGLEEQNVNKFPWYVEKALNYYLNKKMIKAKDIEHMKAEDIVLISVCYITEEYLRESINKNQKTNHKLILHENLQDRTEETIRILIKEMNMGYNANYLNATIKKEILSEHFGKNSVEECRRLADKAATIKSVRDILDRTNKAYLGHLNRGN